jgi:uncharacterized DUF497 family protein
MGSAQSPVELSETQNGFWRGITVFSDPMARIFPDEVHSELENREIIVGHSAAKHLVLVCFTEISIGRVRIISARRTTPLERADYEESFSG